jgi:hypothetical protein
MGYNGKRSRALLLPSKREAFVAIKRFMCQGDVTLKGEEEEILNRWIYCDKLLRAKEDNEEGIIKKIVEAFGVSKFTASNDINNTQRLFADARTINKKYLIHHHLQRIDEDIQKIRMRLFEKVSVGGEMVQSIPDAKEMAAYAKLLESYTYTLNSIPEEIQKDRQPPPIFQFLLAPGQVIETPLAIDDAIEKADEIILKQNNNGTYEMETEDGEDE